MAITKCINSESKQYKPVLTDKLVLDAVPTVNSLNSVTSDGVARAIAGASGEVPQVTENDNGKILTAIYDEHGPAVEWADAPKELPSTLGTAGQVLKVNAGGTGVEWGAAGANYTAGDGIDIDAQNAVSVKAGNGLEIGNASGQGQIQLSSSRVSNRESASYVYDICSLTSDLLDVICNGQGGLSVTLSRPVSFSGQVFVKPGICYFSSTSGGATSGQGVFGESIYIDRTLPAGTTLTFDASTFTNIEWIDLSYLQTLSDSELAEYHLAVLKANGDYSAGSIQDSNPTATSIDTATYTGTVTIQDALNVTNPVPTPASDAAAKVLTVTDTQGNYSWQPVPQELPPIATHAGEVLKVNSGATGVEWGAASGGGSSYSAGNGIAISSDTISAKVDGTTIINQKSTWALTGIAATNSLIIQDSCDNTSSLLIGTATYDYNVMEYVLDWTLSLWRSGQQPRSAGFYRLDLASDSTWVLPSGWDFSLNNQQVKLYAASTDGTTMGTPIALPLYKELSTSSSAWIRYSSSQGTTLPRYVYVYLTDASITALLTCNTLNFGVDRYGSTTMLTAKPTGASLGGSSGMYWDLYEQITGQLGLYDSGSRSESVRIPKSYNYNVTWGDMYDVLQQVRNVSVSAGTTETFYLDYNTSFGGSSYRIPDTWGVGRFFIELLISDQSGVAPTKGWNIQVSYSDNDGNNYNLYRQTIPADANPLASTNKLALSIPVMCQDIADVYPDNASHFYTFRVDIACADTSLAYSYSARLSATGGVRVTA